MRQTLKRYLLMICMAACLFSLTACSGKAASEEETMDPQEASYICQVTEDLLQQVTGLSAEAAETAEADLLKNDENALAGAVTSWIGVMDDTGAFVSVVSSQAELSEDDGYVCTVQAQFANRAVEFKAFYAMDKQQIVPESFSFSPEYTTGEKMTKAAMNTLMGMGTVFCVLIFISLLIWCFKYINVFENKMKAKAAAPAPKAAAAPAPAAAPVVVEEEEELVDDLELVAVITAAIAAATSSSADGLVVRSIKRAPGAKWKRA